MMRARQPTTEVIVDRRRFISRTPAGFALLAGTFSRVGRSFASDLFERQAHELEIASDALEFGDYPLQPLWGVSGDASLFFFRLPRIQTFAELVRRGDWARMTLSSEVRLAYENAAVTFSAPGEFDGIQDPGSDYDLGQRLRAMQVRLELVEAGFVALPENFLALSASLGRQIEEYLAARRDRARLRINGVRITYLNAAKAGRIAIRERVANGGTLTVEGDCERQDLLVGMLDCLLGMRRHLPAEYLSPVDQLYRQVWVELDATLTRSGGSIGVGYRRGDGVFDPELTTAARRHDLSVTDDVIGAGENVRGFGIPGMPTVAGCRFVTLYGSPTYGPFSWQPETTDAYDASAHTIATPYDALSVSTALGVPGV